MESYAIPTGKRFLPDVTKRRLESMRGMEPNGRYRRHFDAAIMRKGGHTVVEIAKELDIHPQTAKRWLSRMVKLGGLVEGYKRRLGRRRSFTPEQLKHLEQDMERHPRHYGLDSDTWTSRTVAQHASDVFGIDVPHHSMRRILTRDGVNWPGSAEAVAARRRGELHV